MTVIGAQLILRRGGNRSRWFCFCFVEDCRQLQGQLWSLELENQLALQCKPGRRSSSRLSLTNWARWMVEIPEHLEKAGNWVSFGQWRTMICKTNCIGWCEISPVCIAVRHILSGGLDWPPPVKIGPFCQHSIIAACLQRGTIYKCCSCFTSSVIDIGFSQSLVF